MVEIIVALIAGIFTLIVGIINLISNKITSKKNVTKEDLQKGIEKVQLDNCKNFLVQMISATDRRDLSLAEKERYFENYDEYIRLGGNSYIHSETERLKEEKRL